MIPKKIHFIWIGDNALKEEYRVFIDQFKLMYYDYEIKVWNDSDIVSNHIITDNLKEFFCDSNFSYAFKADILRYLIVHKYGGLYFDVDFQPLRKIQDCFLSFDFLGAIQNNGEVAIGFFASSQNNQLLKNVIDSIPDSVQTAREFGYYYNEAIYKITGPEFFNRICIPYKNDSNCFFFTKEYFYPYWFEEKHRKHERFDISSPLSYAVHHWEKSWGVV